MDYFCRVYVDSSLQFRDFVRLVATLATGTEFMNTVRSDILDISIDENDSRNQPRQGRRDRWLGFPYTLEIDPIIASDSASYFRAIGTLLTSFWAAGMDAVAACDFEDRLPLNPYLASKAV